MLLAKIKCHWDHLILKLKSAIFYFFAKWYPFNNYEKCFSFHLNSLLHCRDIHIFVFPPSPLFLAVSHCFRGWSKINLKDYDVINCLNKNLIPHFVWYLEKEKSYDSETLSIDRVLNKEHVYRKIKQKINVHQKLVLETFLILLNNPKQPLDGRNPFENKIFWKRIIKKTYSKN